MVDIDTIVSLCKRRGFIFPSSEIYGGFANAWDYGPLGVELKNNIKRAWWRRFVHQRDDVVGLDASIIMNPKVWEVSGHVENFTDPLVDCKQCKKRFRADHLLPTQSLKPAFSRMKKKPALPVSCPECGGELTPTRKFNLMFKTFVGPVENETSTAYLRPETAQAMFVDFNQVMDTRRPSLPFGIAQIGKAFRNEITPGNFIFRTREFEIMEIEYFIREKDWERHFDQWQKAMLDWTESLGADMKKVHLVEIPEDERAHYSRRTVDFEYEYPFGQKELYGLAYRTDFDLKRHSEASGRELSFVDPETKEKLVPHVIEPTWGVDRSVLVCLLSAYREEQAPTAEAGETDKRVVLKFPKNLAPFQAAVLPLSKKEQLSSVAKKLAQDLRRRFTIDYDETQSIGKRYRRQDEIGTPYCITVDFDSLEDKKATVRDRDTMKQDRIALDQLETYLREKFDV